MINPAASVEAECYVDDGEVTLSHCADAARRLGIPLYVERAQDEVRPYELDEAALRALVTAAEWREREARRHLAQAERETRGWRERLTAKLGARVGVVA